MRGARYRESSIESCCHQHKPPLKHNRERWGNFITVTWSKAQSNMTADKGCVEGVYLAVLLNMKALQKWKKPQHKPPGTVKIL